MSRMFRIAALIVTASVALSACSSDKGAGPRDKQIFLALKKTLSFNRKPPAQPHLTRAQITAMKVPLIVADLPRRKAKAYLLRVARNGDVTTWSTTDGTTVSLRQGVLVQTRGLGQDLMSSAPLTAAAIRAGSGQARGASYYLTGDDQSYGVPYQCTLSTAGSGTIDVAEIRYRVRRVDATCQGKDGSFTNSFWVQPDGTIRKSHQWVGPEVGYIDLADLRK